MKTKKALIFLASLILALLLCACGPAPTGFADGLPEDSATSSAPADFTITKNPTDELVEAGGKAKFISYTSAPASTKWFFCDPSTEFGYTASSLHATFPSLIIEGHTSEVLTLTNIPPEMDGFEIYMSASTPDGKTVQSTSARLSVTAPGIKITKHPYSENNIIVGEGTSFIAHAENATSVIWYATNGSKTLLASELPLSECPGLEIYGYDSDKLVLRNVPFSVSGWSFFACFDGADGPVYTEKAYITVISRPAPAPCPPCQPCPPIIIAPCHPAPCCPPCSAPCSPPPYLPASPCRSVETYSVVTTTTVATTTTVSAVSTGNIVITAPTAPSCVIGCSS